MKYLGGKQRLGKHLSPFLLSLWDDINKNKNNIKLNGYLEPFCGSLGVFKHMTILSERGAKTIVGNDYHPDLISMWKEVQSGTYNYPCSISEKQYNDAKKLKSPNGYKAFVGFGMSFGGRYFGAYSQKYLGNKKEDFCKEMLNSLKRTAPLIQNHKVKFTNKSYLSFRPSNKFIYCDPPYEQGKYPIKYRRDTKFYDSFDNEEFWEVMRKWSKTNFVVISELNAPDDFIQIWQQQSYRSAAQSKKTRFNNQNITSETHKTEKLFIHKSLYK